MLTESPAAPRAGSRSAAPRLALVALGGASLITGLNAALIRLEVWAPYAITDVAVHWPGPPVTEVVGDQGCGVVEGVDAETIRAYLGDGNTITDDPGLVVLALLAPQEEACIVRQ